MTVGVQTRPVTLTDRDDAKREFRTELFRSRAEIDNLLDDLRNAGFLAIADVIGSCHSDESGHFHPVQINIIGVTEEAARKILRRVHA